jgi:hypothetical protein
MRLFLPGTIRALGLLKQRLGDHLVTAIFLSCLAWGVLVVYFLLLLRIGSIEVPKPSSIKGEGGWAHQPRTSEAPFTGALLSS